MRRAFHAERPALELMSPRLAARRATLFDADGLQACLASAPDYYARTEGQPPRPGAALEMLSDAEYDDRRHLFLFTPRSGSEVVGVLDLYLDYPEPHTAQIGLLLFREADQGMGYGTEAVLSLEAALLGLRYRALRIAVLDTNDTAGLFWEGLDFFPVGRLDRAATIYEKVLR
jgi:RimJ/RimL family protein N-acetyltransferase